MNIKFKTNVFTTVMVSLLSLHSFASTNDGAVIAGPDNAQITIEEYADFECPYCVRGANTMRLVLKEYEGRVKLVFRNMPLEFHQHALVAAKAFSAVYLQNRNLAYEFYSEIFSNQEQLKSQGVEYLFSMAKTIGVDVEQMKKDMDSDKVYKMLEADRTAAAAHKFTGTPSFMIGNEAVTGSYPYEYIKKIVDRQLGL